MELRVLMADLCELPDVVVNLLPFACREEGLAAEIAGRREHLSSNTPNVLPCHSRDLPAPEGHRYKV